MAFEYRNKSEMTLFSGAFISFYLKRAITLLIFLPLVEIIYYECKETYLNLVVQSLRDLQCFKNPIRISPIFKKC